MSSQQTKRRSRGNSQRFGLATNDHDTAKKSKQDYVYCIDTCMYNMYTKGPNLNIVKTLKSAFIISIDRTASMLICSLSDDVPISITFPSSP